MQGMVRAGSVPSWVTFEGSPGRAAPRSPLHDSWANPAGLTPFEAQLHRGPGSGTVPRLQLGSSVEESAEKQAPGDADGVYPKLQGEPADALTCHLTKRQG